MRRFQGNSGVRRLLNASYKINWTSARRKPTVTCNISLSTYRWWSDELKIVDIYWLHRDVLWAYMIIVRQSKTLCYRRRAARCDVSVKILNKSCTRNPEEIEVMVLDGYCRLTCNKPSAFSHYELDRRRCNLKLDRRRVLLTTSIHHPLAVVKVQSLGQTSRGKYPYFWRYSNFVTLQFRIGQRKPPCQNQLYPSSCFDTTPACDRRTDTQRQHILG